MYKPWISYFLIIIGLHMHSAVVQTYASKQTKIHFNQLSWNYIM
jgi:hypothetical protein